MNSNYTFNGKDIGNFTTGTVTTINSEVVYDTIKYCPFCGKEMPASAQAIIYCPYCGKQLPQTTTHGMFVFHWNYPSGESSWPLRDGIVKPYTTC